MGNNMNLHQRETFTRNKSNEMIRIGTLLADLQRSLELIKVEIALEEDRSPWRSLSDPRYPALGRALRARQENLAATIQVLENRAKGLVVPKAETAEVA